MKSRVVLPLKEARKLSIYIKNIRVIDPQRSLDTIMDVYIDNGVLRIPGEDTKFDDSIICAKQIDGTGLWLVPGLVDMHVHLREPGEEYKETIETGSQAAVAGGVVAVAAMPNTKLVNDNEAVTRFILDRARDFASCYVYPVAAITKGLAGEELTEMGELVKAGAVAFSDDGNPVMNSQIMRRALEYSKIFGVPIISHCEDRLLSANGVMNEGKVSLELGLRGIPRIAEEIMVARDIAISGYTGAKVHIAHVSTAGSVELIRKAKQEGINVTAETAPHYFTLTEDEVRSYDARFKVNPPLRTEQDVDAILQGLSDGTIDVIATDHAPHSVLEKDVEFDFAAFGMIGLETSLAVSLDLVRKGVLSPLELIRKMSSNPASILDIPFGFLEKGGPVSFAVVDPDKEWAVKGENLFSRGVNCPYEGRTLKGKVKFTVVDGCVVFAEEEYSWLAR